MLSMTETNPELERAGAFVGQTGSNLFLTGKAGTGKTTFLRNLHSWTHKQFIITAPTGVAAINAGGVTLHSFFQLPLGPFVPGSNPQQGESRIFFKLSREKKDIIKNLDLLVIDEISMVRADLLDAVDTVLRRYRSGYLPFGGVQLLMIGDLHQLPPVAKREEWDLLRRYYESVYFFSSHALKQSGFVTIELQHIYRQTDESFIRILNQLRDNRLDEHSIGELNKRYVNDFIPEKGQGYITLTTHNKKAESINNSRLRGLSEKEYCFKAKIRGDFPKHVYPAPERLLLKKGAQVMFLRNDNTSEKRYFNGKIGRVVNISDDSIGISCPDDPGVIHVEMADWENIKYSFNRKKMNIEGDVVGLFKQFPLKLAWAITIHKSQGLTFEKAIIDSADAFVHGQIYVALSRCKTLEGMVLSSPIPATGIQKDRAIEAFDAGVRTNPTSDRDFEQARARFQQDLILNCFDFTELRKNLLWLVNALSDGTGTVRVPDPANLTKIINETDQEIVVVGQKFRRQLSGMFQDHPIPEGDSRILDRLQKASVWFQEKITEILKNPMENLQFVTDDSNLKQKIHKQKKDLEKEIAVKLAGIKTLENGFSPADYLQAVSHAEVKPEPMKNDSHPPVFFGEKDTVHADLASDLLAWRSEKALQEEKDGHQILKQKTLFRIAETQPAGKSKLKKIKGVGEKTVRKYGEEIIAIVSRYREEHDKSSDSSPDRQAAEKTEVKTKRKRSETRRISFDLFNSGMTIQDIANERGLVISTIEGHLSTFVERGKLDINRLVPEEKQHRVEESIKKIGTESLKAIKEQLDDTVSYGEIKMVLAHLAYRSDSVDKG